LEAINMTSKSGPLFSIATPTRDALGLLRRCVGSVRGQQSAVYEHLLQDAESTDGTGQWLKDESRWDARLLPVTESDVGMYDAINRAWRRSRGNILSWLNSDEQYLPQTLQAVQGYFDARPEIDAVFGDYLVVDDAGRAIALRREIPLRRVYIANGFLNAMSCTLFFRRRLLDNGLLSFDTQWHYAADKDMVLKMVDAGVRFGHMPKVLSMFGVNGSNLSAHTRMQDEAEAIRVAHGGFRFKPLRAMFLMSRRIERFVRGGYAASDFEYDFALDEIPHYARYRGRSLGGRYTLADTQGRAERIDASTGVLVSK